MKRFRFHFMTPVWHGLATAFTAVAVAEGKISVDNICL